MIKRSLFYLLLLTLAFSKMEATEKKPATRIVPVVELTAGSSYERGAQHGRELANQIAEVITKFKANIQENTGKDPDTVISEFLKATNFQPAIEKYTPGLLDEIKGIAYGSRQDLNDIFAFQLLDEFWVYLDQLKNSSNHHCSSIGVAAAADHPAYIAQNMDLETYLQGYQVLLHIAATEKEPEQYVLSSAGLIALTGMNAKGIGVCVNTLMELKASSDGLPVACVVRGILSKSSGEDALKYVQGVKHASGQNYLLGVQEKVYDFEASANEVVRFLPTNNTNLVFHTNHALVNNDVKPWYEEYHQKVLAGETGEKNSETRFASLTVRLDKPVSDISIDVIKSTLRSQDNQKYPISRNLREGVAIYTFSSVVFTLTGKRSVQVTFGPPDQSQYQEHFFSAQ